MTKLFCRLPFAVLAFAVSISSANAAPIMYVHDEAGRLGTVDVQTGATNVIGTMGAIMTDIAFDPSGNLFGVSFTSLYSINPTTAASTFIGNLGISTANALVFGSNGTLYMAGTGTTNLYTVNTSTGAATSLGNMGAASAGDLAFNGGNLYLATTADQLRLINLANLAASSTVGSFGVSGVFGLATGDNGQLYAVAGTNIYTVNTITGAAINPVSFAGQGLTTAFGQSFFTESGAPPQNPVPEPTSMLLLGTGLAGLVRSRLKK